MRKILILIILLLATGNMDAQNQTSQVTVSTEKIRENGVLKYVHHVKQGETLYSISKAYGVPTQEILKNNPNLQSGLRAGMILFIPVTESGTESVNTQAETRNYRKHTAKWYETVDDIALKYNVSAEDLMALNKLRSKELSRRQVLLIPDKKTYAVAGRPQENPVQQQQQEDPAKQENRQVTADKTEESTPVFSEPTPRRNRYEAVDVSVILPLNGRDSAALNSNFMDFYAGALLAVNKLKEEGMNIRVNLFDQNAYSSVNNMVATGKLDGSHFIIGPVREHNIKEILGFSNANAIPVISPMDQSAEQYISGNPYFIQVPTKTDIQIENLLSQLKNDYERSRGNAGVLLCYEKNGADTAFIRMAENYLKDHNIHYSTISYNILEGRGMLQKINSVLDHSKKNLVLVPSNSEAFVNDLVRNLSLSLSHVKANPEYAITLYGMPKWRNFETIEPEYFHKMNLHLSLPYHIDYNDREVKDFLLQFRALYKTEPSPYAFQGYDIMKFFLPRANEYGKDFVNTMQMKNGKMLQSDYSFSREGLNGFENKATRNIQYNPDYTISTLELY